MNFGNSVAVSSDGRSTLVGTRIRSYLFERSDGNWVRKRSFEADGKFPGEFGEHVALGMNGAVALIGAPRERVEHARDGNVLIQGAVYVFEKTPMGEWRTQQKLTTNYTEYDVVPDDKSRTRFGEQVAVSEDGSTILVAEPDNSKFEENAGAIHVFTRTDEEWRREEILYSYSPNTYMGPVALDADGSIGLVGASGGEGVSSVAVMSLTGKRERHELLRGLQEDNIGKSVSISHDGRTAIIGASGKVGEEDGDKGVAYVFGRRADGWQQQAILEAPDGDPGDHFNIVVISGDGTTAMLGVPGDNTAHGEDAGSAYVFTRSGDEWEFETKLVPDTGESDAHFGVSGALSATGEITVVGADRQGDDGAAYVFELDSLPV